MPKATPAKFADAKRRALRTLGQQAPDSYVPDRVMFFNDDLGFTVQLSDLSEDHHVQRLVPWSSVELAQMPIIEDTVSLAVESLARAQAN